MMIARNKAWWIEKAEREGNVTIGAGAAPPRAAGADQIEALAAMGDPARLAMLEFMIVDSN